MILNYLNDWLLFSICFGLMLLVSFIMMVLSRRFYTNDVIIRKFSIMELEVPATAQELVNIVKGLFLLPADKSKKAVSALKTQLWLDFLFMPLAYGSIFLLCWRVAHKMDLSAGKQVFLWLAYAQALPFLFDIIENIYLLQKIKQQTAVQASTDKTHTAYLYMELAKWGIALTATTCGLSAISYFWLTGSYTHSSFIFLLIVLAELLVVLIITAISNRKYKQQQKAAV